MSLRTYSFDFYMQFKSKLSNLDMAVAFMSQNCSDFAFENRPKDDPSLDDLIHHTLSHEIMITSKRGEFSGDYLSYIFFKEIRLHTHLQALQNLCIAVSCVAPK